MNSDDLRDVDPFHMGSECGLEMPYAYCALWQGALQVRECFANDILVYPSIVMLHCQEICAWEFPRLPQRGEQD